VGSTKSSAALRHSRSALGFSASRIQTICVAPRSGPPLLRCSAPHQANKGLRQIKNFADGWIKVVRVAVCTDAHPNLLFSYKKFFFTVKVLFSYKIIFFHTKLSAVDENLLFSFSFVIYFCHIKKYIVFTAYFNDTVRAYRWLY
jgi:hypothetical protein